MKKKIEKKFIINSSEWSKTSVSIIEANQTQQTVILGFNENSDLGDYALCVCTLSPLLGTPERISEFFFDLLPLSISENKKVYIIFSDEDMESSLDDEQNILLSKKSLYPFSLKDDEAVGLLKKNGDDQSWKLIDWSKPIIDEIIPLDMLQEASQIKVVQQNDFYKSKKVVKNEDIQNTEKNQSSFFEKPLIWLLIFISTISIFEIASLVSLNEQVSFIIVKISTIFLKNTFSGFFLFKWIRSGFKFSPSLIIILLLAIGSYILTYFLFIIGIFIGSALLILIVSIYSFLTKVSK
jgi:hypothetical protein